MNYIEIFSDFDGTITKKDAITLFMELYADSSWYDIEKDWMAGKIGSAECMSKQFALLPPITDKILEDFFKKIEIDDYFIEFYNLIKSKKINFYILSDGFDFFIKRILQKYNLSDIPVYSNKLTLNNGVFKVNFPNISNKCKIMSALCKCQILNKLRNVNKKTIYIGDGLSDICVCSKVDILFAKNSLKNYCVKNDIDFIDFNTFREVIHYDGLKTFIR